MSNRTIYTINGSTVTFTDSQGEEHTYKYLSHQQLKFECECGVELVICNFEILNTSFGPIKLELGRCEHCSKQMGKRTKLVMPEAAERV